MLPSLPSFLFFFFNDTATTEIYTLSLHDRSSDLTSPPPGISRSRRSPGTGTSSTSCGSACSSLSTGCRGALASPAGARGRGPKPPMAGGARPPGGGGDQPPVPSPHQQPKQHPPHRDARPVPGLPLYQRVRVTGRLDGARQFLLDNRTYRGRAGYEVLTPLTRAGAAPLLIDRGWVPFTGTRARLPDISFEAAAPVSLSGRIAQLPSPGLASGRSAPEARAAWPKVTSYPSVAELSAALGAPLAARIVLLDPQAPFGYLRDWQPPGMAPLRHLSYAIQWWSFAALALIVWAIMSTRRTHAAASG